MQKQKFANKMKQLNKDNQSYALGQFIFMLSILAIAVITWVLTT